MKTQILISFIFAFQLSGSQSIFGEHKVIRKSISERWELDDKDKNSAFKLTYDKPVYVSPMRWSDNPNEIPQNENLNSSFEDPENYIGRLKASFIYSK
jgi:phospholipase A1